MISNVKENLSKVLHYSGTLVLNSLISKKRLTIINFHRIVSDDEKSSSPNKSMMATVSQFEEIIKMVSRYTNPITLKEATRLTGSLSPRSTVITFDDGYADNYTNAYPILKRYQVPATIFLSTRYINQNKEWFWWDEVEYFFKVRKEHHPKVGYNPTVAPALIDRINELVPSQPGRTDKIRTFIHDLYDLTEKDRDLLAVYLRKFHVHPEEPLMLTWDQINSMIDVFEIGSHTVNHLFLNNLNSSEVEEELVQSRAVIQKNVDDIECKGICYPAGFVSPEIAGQALPCGYKYGVTTNPSNNGLNTNSYLLNRKDAGYFFVNGKLEKTYFFFVLSSLYDLFRSLKKDG